MHRADRINYDEIAHRYERHRSGSEEIAKELARLAHVDGDAVVLDVGCGTGSASAAFQQLTEATVCAVDASAEMLRYAQRKSRAVKLVRADARRLPFCDARFDFAYALMLIHHLEDVPGFVRELYRVMRRGKVAILTCSHEWIKRHPMSRFFPSFAPIDLARFPQIGSVRRWLRDAGFVKIDARPVKTKPYIADMEYIDKVADRWVSTLQLIPDDEFQEGLKKLRKAVGSGTLTIHWEGLLLTAVKG